MTFSLKVKKNLFSIFLLLFFSLIISCSDSSAEIISATGTVVFDYKDSESKPDVYLSVYLQTESEAQRANFVKVYSPDKKYSWNIAEPVIFSGNNKSYAGYSVLRFLDGKELPCGVYSVEYRDAAGEQSKSTFSISYNSELLLSNSKNAKEKSGLKLTENVILYDKDFNMLFFGNMKNSWRKRSNITKDYSRAVYLRKTLTTNGTALMLKLPLEEIKKLDTTNVVDNNSETTDE